ncbi:uncharacterized protein [Panulirus ornatus]|uniref:uncharacterized protein n=1 Tax=Panulirus ornatus TaxID=150431 RepID=UPI003A8B7F76
MSLSTFTLFLLGIIAQVSCQKYDPHYSPVYVPPVTSYTTETVTVTHTLRETSTSDVWVTEHTLVEALVTQFTTNWKFLPEDPDTRVSVVKVTSTPIVIVTATTGYNPVKTFVSVFTEFETTTETVDFIQSITHISVIHQIHTVPVVSTQQLVQEVISTTTHIVTVTVTSQGYY